jgi:hypothetical protein
MVSIVFSDPVPGLLPHRILKLATIGKRAAFMAWMRGSLAGIFGAPAGTFGTSIEMNQSKKFQR